MCELGVTQERMLVPCLLAVNKIVFGERTLAKVI